LNRVFFLSSTGNVLEKGFGEKTFTKVFSPIQGELNFGDGVNSDYDSL
jgi:hypothetical protein